MWWMLGASFHTVRAVRAVVDVDLYGAGRRMHNQHNIIMR